MSEFNPQTSPWTVANLHGFNSTKHHQLTLMTVHGWQWIIRSNQDIVSAETYWGFSSVIFQLFELWKQNRVGRNLSDGYFKISAAWTSKCYLKLSRFSFENTIALYIPFRPLTIFIFYEGLQTTHTWRCSLYYSVVDELFLQVSRAVSVCDPQAATVSSSP